MTMRMLTLMLMLAVGCSKPAPHPGPPLPPAEKVELPGLENTFRVTPRIYSGSSPESDESFAALVKLGVTTIVSVDGAAPEVALAAKHGLTYVHLPVGYDGIPAGIAFKLARVIQSRKEPLYVHCHHGKHRGPAAVAAARLCLEPEYTAADAVAWMTAAGTDPKYKGLMEVPKLLKRPRPDELEKLPDSYPAEAEVRDLTRLMVHVDTHWDSIKLARTKDFTSAEPHAVMLLEDYREMKRLQLARTKGREFLEILAEAEAAALVLSEATRAGDAKAAADAMTKSQNLCSKCHAKFRD